MTLRTSEIKFICKNVSKVSVDGKRRKKTIIRDGLSFSLLDEVADRYDSQAKRLLNNSSFMPKFSEKYLESKLQSLLVHVLKDNISDLSITSAIEHLQNELVSFEEEQRVLIPLAGIRMKLDEFDCGAITLRRGGHDLLDSVLDSIAKISKESKSSPEVQEQFQAQCGLPLV